MYIYTQCLKQGKGILQFHIFKPGQGNSDFLKAFNTQSTWDSGTGIHHIHSAINSTETKAYSIDTKQNINYRQFTRMMLFSRAETLAL